MTEDRGVTEVLGFVLVIALVTIVVAVVMTTGISGLTASQQAEQVSNMERGFDVLAHNIEALADRNAPSRGTELRIAGGTIEYGDVSWINVTHEGELIGNLSIAIEPIVYASGEGTQIVHEGGAVIRTDQDHHRMLREPRLLLSEGQLIVHGVRTRPMGGSPTQVARPGTMLIRTEYLGVRVEHVTRHGGEALTVRIDSSRAAAWTAYLEELGLENVTTNGGVVSASVPDDEVNDPIEVYVVRTRTRVAFID